MYEVNDPQNSNSQESPENRETFSGSKFSPATGVRPLPFNHSRNRSLVFQKSSFGILLPFNHLYQACSGPGLREVLVDTFQLSGSRGTTEQKHF